MTFYDLKNLEIYVGFRQEQKAVFSIASWAFWIEIFRN
jgi:hypothetical protein